MRYKCDCCGYYTLLEESDEICPVCGWQEDNVQRRYPDSTGGANYEISLNEAKKNYEKLGVFNLKYINDVRKPLTEELPENNL
ncbi:CPCC family cysteine-rich protein [Enterococcus hulanensis]|uniref:CPCC family cysteine-rich protein n=1 Tax=Enterococcus hulanensis TaxID=2559929 RepID=UPI00289103BD|nr:CPCC family cysteine-rich protein [Enterococcus hulanensis]MDT2660324.1 CPCC family cysteine-rich protein [Enterococcus hulanensis]